RRVRSRRPQAARGSESLGWPTDPGFTRSPDRKERAIGRCVWPRITNGAPAFWTSASSAVHGNTYSSSSRGLPWNIATTPSGIVVRVRSSRSFRYPTSPGVRCIPRPIGAEGYMTFSIRGKKDLTIQTTRRREPRHLCAVTLPDRLPMESEEVLRPKPLDPGRPLLRAEEPVLHRPGAPRAGDHGEHIAMHALERELGMPCREGRGPIRPSEC